MIVNDVEQRWQHFTKTKPKTDCHQHQNTSRDIDLSGPGLARQYTASPHTSASGIMDTRLCTPVRVGLNMRKRN
jgi:hypothetical protein